MTGPVTHSALGASSAERWFNCSGSARLCASLPEQPDSVYAREGTRAHALAQHCLENGFKPAAALIGQPVPGLDKDPTPVTDDMADAVQVYIDAITAALKGRPTAKLFVEQKFKLPFLGPDIDGSTPGGTNDACIFDTETRAVDLYDYKHGAGKWVDVRANKQLLYYALGCQAWFRAHGVEITAVRMSIVQPRCEYSEQKVRSVSVSLDELWDYREDAIMAAHKCRQDNAPFTPGAWCRGTWCKGALQLACEAFKDASTKGLITKPKRSGADFMMAAPAPVTLDPTRMGPDELGERLVQAELLADYLACLKEHAEAEATAGRMPTGWRWGTGRGSRQWVATETEVLATLQRQTNAGDFAPRKLVSVAQAEKIIGKARFERSPELQRLWVTEAGKPKLEIAD